MFGREYLDWCAERKAGELIDEFLAEMEPEDRKWALAVMRKRHEVRVEYRDSPLMRLGQAALTQNTLPSAFDRQRLCGQQHLGTSGSVLGALVRDFGL